MKKLALSVLIIGACYSQSASAQVKISLGVNIGCQPVWGPTGYDHAEYYYLPDYDVYYDVPRKRYIYWQGSRRIITTSLPARYRNVDLYKSYKVVINEPNAYKHHDDDMRKYAQYKGRHDQADIRDSHEEKYWQIKDHPDHNKWKGNKGDNRGHRH